MVVEKKLRLPLIMVENMEKRGLGRLKSEVCAICIDGWEEGGKVRELPCNHVFHQSCIDPWLLKHAILCPVCKRSILTPTLATSQKTRSFSSPVSSSFQFPRHTEFLPIPMDDAPLIHYRRTGTADLLETRVGWIGDSVKLLKDFFRRGGELV
ncbi:hypothetical protein BC832DRAFT_302113 [Gaertneriomyces semiglobifer]|nr:hypothetical protein BC832DRAFT_302113 [Gaertneriomyces semiglobifer]